MPQVVMYTTTVCPYCLRAKSLLDGKGVNYQEINIDHDRELMQEMMRRSNRHTVPQIFIDDFHVGGYDDLSAMDEAGRLDTLLGIEQE